jgi:hypothetical protein
VPPNSIAQKGTISRAQALRMSNDTTGHGGRPMIATGN